MLWIKLKRLKWAVLMIIMKPFATPEVIARTGKSIANYEKNSTIWIEVLTGVQ